MIITNDLVETFLKCPTKCFLRSRGEAGTGNAYAAWVRTKNDVFRIEGTKRLVAGVAPDKCAIGTQGKEGSLKPAQWHLGIEFTVQSQNLQCFCHAVEQIPSAGRGRTAQFVPIRFVFRNKLNRDDKLLLAFDARVLSEELSREVGLGKIVHGENYTTLKVKIPALASDVSVGGTAGNKPKRLWRRKNSSLITWRIAPRWNWSPVPLHKPADKISGQVRKLRKV
jgi:hypothetical protein